MASPKIDSDLEIFLNYDFSKQENEKLLGVYKDCLGKSRLCTCDANSNKVYYQNINDNFPDKINKTLKKLITCIEEKQELWLRAISTI